MKKPDKCFVVMPFGKKPFPHDPAKLYDFDKVYRVAIRPAIIAANLEPHRADEESSSSLIHTDMFQDLRDRPVVLVDLSLNNPNVFYELGIRHVMAQRGTVLICEKGTTLPFDVALSRVIFYEFDGRSFDWEEVERIKNELATALREAHRRPDSPVHAFLDYVLPKKGTQADVGLGQQHSPADDPESLAGFQDLVAEYWRSRDASGSARDIEALLQEYESSPFGTAALGAYCLAQDPPPAGAVAVARQLKTLHQVDRAAKLYAQLDKSGVLEVKDLMSYGSMVSEADQKLTGAERGLEIQRRGFEIARANWEKNPTDPDAASLYAYCARAYAALLQWRWILTRDPASCDEAIRYQQEAIDVWSQLHPSYQEVDLIARTHLKLLFLLRQRDQNPNRVDAEGHLAAVLKLPPSEREPRSQAEEVDSWLAWYKVIAFVDRNEEEQALELARRQLVRDASLQGGKTGIGRRQYFLLRRFMNQNAEFLRNPRLRGRVVQMFQYRQV